MNGWPQADVDTLVYFMGMLNHWFRYAPPIINLGGKLRLHTTNYYYYKPEVYEKLSHVPPG
jgi:hypothetical protein